MSECKHPTCGETCRRPKKEKKIYQLKRCPIKKKPVASASKANALPYSQLLQLAQFTFNKWIRKRDENKPCISCGEKADDKGRPLTMQAGHYYPAGKYSGVRFDEINVNGQAKWDNEAKEGALDAYRAGLISRYGIDAVLDLDLKAKATMYYKWSREELQEIIEKYKL